MVMPLTLALIEKVSLSRIKPSVTHEPFKLRVPKHGKLVSEFSQVNSCQCGSQGAPGKESLSESKLRDLLHSSEYVLTYEDKDGDWMLVGDVPWE
ncbi:hypothetical protein L6452_39067 [Arctium lappa]|uniref:Uncharacterized protein n=1 Tax=Arctium lappa TaxID=4217 RepID=A0ACB8XSZ6_ARCLA|nr:hypothetical protein L6452_39067 [Arctium lappa]